MKKFLSVLLAVLMLASAMPLGVFAQTQPTFYATATAGCVGTTVTVDVGLRNNPGIASFVLRIGYDAAALELVEVESLQYTDMVISPAEKNPITLNWFDGLLEENCTDEGAVVRLTFTVRSGAAAGEYPITLSHDPADVFDINLEDVAFATESGSVTVTNHTYDSTADADCNYCGLTRNVATIITQPKSVCVAEGEKAIVSFEATGDGLKYAWYWAKPGAATFYITSTFTSNTYSVDMNSSRDGRRVYCEITDAYGNTVRTETASVNMLPHTYDNACDVDCNLCGETRTTEHAYDNACDAACNVCGETREVGDHSYDNACDTDCNVCGAVREVGEHAYDNACDVDCNICGAVREVGEHTYDNVCDTDCNECFATREVGDHIYDNACDTDCNECGAVREVGEHIYDNACDTDCNECFATREVGEHIYDYACDADCNECGAIRETAHEYAVECDGVCRICGQLTNPEAAHRVVRMPAVEPSCTQIGHIEYWSCFFCTQSFLDEACTQPVAIKDVVLPKAEHTYDTACDADCNVCGETREVGDHIYDNACDADCNECFATREVGEHAYDNACDVDCNECGAPREVGDHIYDNACDADCNECFATREVGEHIYDNACDADCNECGATREVGEHTYDNACDSDCNECGSTREVGDHTYDNACDADCNICGAVRAAGHTYDYACDTDCNVCGKTRVTDHLWEQVDFVDLGDGTHQYSVVCAYCGEIFDDIFIFEHYDGEMDHVCDGCGACIHEYEMPLVSGTQNGTHTYAYDCYYCSYTRYEEEACYGGEATCVERAYCTVCGNAYGEDVDGHIYDNDCDTDCNACGETREAIHTYDHACDTDCNLCGAVRTIQHRYTNICDATCTVCGAENPTPAPHNYINACATECTRCGDVREQPDHTSDAYISCQPGHCTSCGVEVPPRNGSRVFLSLLRLLRVL